MIIIGIVIIRRTMCGVKHERKNNLSYNISIYNNNNNNNNLIQLFYYLRAYL
jgi:hypothetical protein